MDHPLHESTLFTARPNCLQVAMQNAVAMAIPSVCVSVRLSSVTRWYPIQTNKDRIMRSSRRGSKIIFCHQEWLGRRPLLPKICAQSDPPLSKRRLRPIFAYNVSNGRVRDEQRIDAFLWRNTKYGFCQPDLPSFHELCDYSTSDEQLFDKIQQNEYHLLHYLLHPPSATSQCHNLRTRPLLGAASATPWTPYLTDSNFTTRILYKNIYAII